MPVPIHEAKAELFRTLGHPVRIRVLELLSERDHAVHEMLKVVDSEPSALSQQLGVLRRAGLIRQQRVAGEVVYSLLVPELRDVLVAARAMLSRRLADAAQLQAALDDQPLAPRATS